MNVMGLIAAFCAAAAGVFILALLSAIAVFVVLGLEVVIANPGGL